VDKLHCSRWISSSTLGWYLRVTENGTRWLIHGLVKPTRAESIPTQAAELGFLRRVHGVTPCDKVGSCEIRKALSVEPLLRIKRSQLRSRSRVQNIPGKIGEQVLLATHTGRRPTGCRRTRWSGYISDLG